MNYLDKLQRVISSLNLEEPVFNKKDVEKGTFIVFGRVERRRVVLKTFPEDNTKRYRGFVKEKSLSELKEDPRCSDAFYSILAPRFITEGKLDTMIWYLREFEDGEVMGIDQKDAAEALWNCDKIAGRYEGLNREFAPRIVAGLKRLQSADLQTVKSKLGKLNQERFPVEDLEAKSIEFEQTLNLDLATQRKLFAEDKNLLNRNITLCLNDLVPPNILIQGREIKFLDLENICLDHYLTDLVELWLFLWRYPEWQKNLLEEWKLAEDEKLSFRLLVIRRIILSGMHNRFKRYDTAVGHQHKWLDYLGATSISYDELINT